MITILWLVSYHAALIRSNVSLGLFETSLTLSIEKRLRSLPHLLISSNIILVQDVVIQEAEYAILILVAYNFIDLT